MWPINDSFCAFSLQTNGFFIQNEQCFNTNIHFQWYQPNQTFICATQELLRNPNWKSALLIMSDCVCISTLRGMRLLFPLLCCLGRTGLHTLNALFFLVVNKYIFLPSGFLHTQT